MQHMAVINFFQRLIYLKRYTQRTKNIVDSLSIGHLLQAIYKNVFKNFQKNILIFQ